MSESRHRPTAAIPSRFYGLGENVIEVTLQEPGASPSVPEALTQSIWEQGRFDRSSMRTTDGQPIAVRTPGSPNRDAGPDFLRASIQLSGMDWTGDVEIHNSSAQWFEHQHHRDPRYNSVILHVTLHADMWTGRLTREDGTTIPEVVIYPLLEQGLRDLLYDFYSTARRPIACAASWSTVDADLRNATIGTQGVERIRSRLDGMSRHATESQLEQVLYERIFAALGYSKNSEPMLELARRIPLAQARSIRHDELEATYLGTAGLLPSPADLLDADRATADRAMALRHTYERIRHALDLEPMVREAWLFFRLRPANFPPRRIAQGAALVRPGGLMHQRPLRILRRACRTKQAVKGLRNLFRVDVPGFWETHVRLDRRARSSSAAIGRQRIDEIIMNAVLPVLLFDAERKKDDDLARAALSVAESLPSENNEVTRLFDQLGSRPANALESQGVQNLYRLYCQEMRCLSCRIGRVLLGDRPES